MPWVIAAAGVVAYFNTLRNPFVFDDLPRIARSPHVRHLWPPAEVLAETSRPLVQLTFALNYAISGLDVWSYHVFNLAVHVLAGLVLFALVRRTLRLPALGPELHRRAHGLSLAATLIWLVHPLQTASVTYVVQRSESLAGLLYLTTLYAVLRGAASGRPAVWYALGIAACALGVFCKQVIITAPLMVLLFDLMFLAEGWGELWRKRWPLYAGLLGSLALVPIALANGPLDWRSSAGLLAGVSPAEYARSQPGVVVHYMRLALWPVGLVFDYGWPVASRAGAVVAPAMVLAAIGGATAWGIVRGQRWVFLVLWWFVILLPTSSVFPIADLAFEHRVYLSLAAVGAGAVIAAAAFLERVRQPLGLSTAAGGRVAAVLLVTLLVTLTVLTIQRNRDFGSALRLWSDTVRKRPENPRARVNLGLALMAEGRPLEAEPHLKSAVRLRPNDAIACLTYGYYLSMAGRNAESLPYLRQAVAQAPENGEAHFTFGAILLAEGEVDSAYAQLSAAARLEPDRPATHYNLGRILEQRGDVAGAIARYREAIRLAPEYGLAHASLGLALERAGRLQEASAELRTALRWMPQRADLTERLEAIERQLRAR